MGRLLINRDFLVHYGERFREVCRMHRLDVEPLTLPDNPDERFDDATLGTIELAAFTGVWEIDPVFTRRFLGSCLRARALRWLHMPNAGVDHPVFAQLLSQGVRLTTSSGATAEPIAQTAIAAMLALARGFPAWAAAQRRHEWKPLRARRDLRGQTMIIVGLGAIGNEVGRLAKAFNLKVIGIRRSPQRPGDHADEMYSPAELARVLPRADWLVLTCPLTDETRHVLNAAMLSLLPPTAHVINVGRGQLIDEPALIAALKKQRLAGAYLDVFAEEPLPARSPLWDLPNVIISPHDSAGSSGNAARVSEIFLRNLRHWAQGEELENEVREV